MVGGKEWVGDNVVVKKIDVGELNVGGDSDDTEMASEEIMGRKESREGKVEGCRRERGGAPNSIVMGHTSWVQGYHDIEVVMKVIPPIHRVKNRCWGSSGDGLKGSMDSDTMYRIRHILDDFLE